MASFYYTREFRANPSSFGFTMTSGLSMGQTLAECVHKALCYYRSRSLPQNVEIARWDEKQKKAVTVRPALKCPW